MVQENVNLLPTDVLNSALPWWQFGPSIAQSLAQTSFGNLSNIQQAQIQAGASTQNAATQAGATIGAAGIGAQSRIDSQLIATNGAIAQANAQMKTDAVLAQAGDINAYRRLVQTQQYTSQLENNKNRMEIAKLAGSGSLFDNIAARYAAAGRGPLPQAGGAFLGGGIQNVSAPTGNAPMSIADILKFIPQAAQQSGGGGFDFSSLAGLLGGASGGSTGAQLPGIGDIFSGLNQQVFDSLRDVQGPLFVDTPLGGANPVRPPLLKPGDPGYFTPQPNPISFTSGVTGDPTQSVGNTQSAWEALLANPDAFLHKGGKLKPGESGIVGDDRGRLTPFSELVRNVNGEVEITPIGGRGLGNFRGRFHTGTGPHKHDTPETPDVFVKPPEFDPPSGVLPPEFEDRDAFVTPAPAPPPAGVLPPEFEDRDALGGGDASLFDFGDRRLQFTQSRPQYTPTPEETAEIEQQARALVDQRIASAPWYNRSRMQGNYQGMLNTEVLKLTQALVAQGPSAVPEEAAAETPTETTPPGEVGESDGTIGGREGDTDGTSTYTPGGILSDVSNIPALSALRGNPTQSIFDFGKDYFSRPEQGIDPLPSPFNFGKNFLTMPNSQRQDVLDFYQSQFALKPEDTMAMFFASQPGNRRFGGNARAF